MPITMRIESVGQTMEHWYEKSAEDDLGQLRETVVRSIHLSLKDERGSLTRPPTLPRANSLTIQFANDDVAALGFKVGDYVELSISKLGSQA